MFCAKPPRVGLASFVLLVAWQVLALGIALLVVDPRRQPILYASSFLAASLPWMLLSWAVLQGRLRLRWTHVMLAALGLRIFVQLAAPAVLSDDIWRYIWEGRIQLAGYNPFVDSPQELASLGHGVESWERLNNRAISAAYPPVGQLFLRFLAALGAGPRGLRMGFALCDFATFLLLSLGLIRRGLDPLRSLIHGLCPLPIVEICVEGHNDGLGIALVVAAFAFAVTGRPAADGSKRDETLAGGFFGLAVSAKYLPVLLLPWYLRPPRWRLIAIAIVVFMISWLPFWPGLDRAQELFSGLGEYGARWRHNDSGFVLIRWLTASAQEVLRGMGSESWLATAHEDRVAKIPLALLFALGSLWIFFRVRDPARAFVALLTLLFVLAPTVHPWYVCWIVPFLAFAPRPAPFALIAMLGFSYHILQRFHTGDGKWVEDPVWKIVEFLPFYLVLLAGPRTGLLTGPLAAKWRRRRAT